MFDEYCNGFVLLNKAPEILFLILVYIREHAISAHVGTIRGSIFALCTLKGL